MSNTKDRSVVTVFVIIAVGTIFVSAIQTGFDSGSVTKGAIGGLVAAGLLLGLLLIVAVLWLGKKLYDATFDDPLTRAFVDAAKGRVSEAYIGVLWIVSGLATAVLFTIFDDAGDTWLMGIWLVSVCALLPLYFAAYYYIRGIRARRFAKKWTSAAEELGLNATVDSQTAAPIIVGDHAGRPVKLTVEPGPNSHRTVAEAEFGTHAEGIEIASSESLYFRPNEGCIIGADNTGSQKLRVYGGSQAIAERLARPKFFARVEELENMTDELRIGPKTILAHCKSADASVVDIDALVSTLCDIADLIDDTSTEAGLSTAP